MKCPFCDYFDTKVIDSRATEDNTSIRRRRACEKCGEKFTTYERIEIINVLVIKKDLTRENFDRNKILKGIVLSCNKRPVTRATIDELVKDVESTIYNSGKKEIESYKIGEMIMDKLSKIDEVAYVRFASVYRSFKDIDSFKAELEKIEKEKKIN